MPLIPGTRLGPYEVIAPLGAGGMGEVYRARDTRLGRDVAIKVLPEHLDGPEVRARFEREARTISALNHPNICTLFDVGREGDAHYLVMELVEGETLAQRLERGPMPVAEALRVGVQIADALDRAHRAGVIHRDLKPGNVMLTKSGAKLMDFGLARRAAEGGEGGLGPASSATAIAMTRSPTVAAPLTAQGTIIGTFQYMAPEQLEGLEADTRSDIWALGCVLYEMVTGRRAFEGKSQASMIGAIMHSEPKRIAEAAPMAPPALDELVRTCLAKDPDERWQSAGDIRRELQRISGTTSAVGAPAVARPRRGFDTATLGWAVAAVVLAAALVYQFGPWSHRGVERLAEFEIPGPANQSLQDPAEAALSPDGRMLAYIATDSTFVTHVFVRAIARVGSRLVPGTDHAGLPFWSPDGRTLAFFSQGKLRTIGLDGGSPAVLCDAPDPRGGAWSSRGVIVFAPSSQGAIWRVPAGGGAPVQITKLAPGQRGHRYPQFLPDGRHFLYVAITPSDEVVTYAASIDGGTPVEVVRGGSKGCYAPPGYLMYLEAGLDTQERRLLAKRFDPGRLRVTGDARLVLDDVHSNNFGYTNVTTDARGDLVVQQGTAQHREIGWLDRSGHAIGATLDLDGIGPKVSPDCRRVAYQGNDPKDLFVLDLGTGVSTRLTFENRPIGSIVWSRDGSRIAFARLMGTAGWEARVKSADGTGPDTLAFRAPGLFAYPQSWTPDDRSLVVAAADAGGSMDLWRASMDGHGAPVRYQQTPEQETSAALSPDGRWIAYFTSQVAAGFGVRSLYIQSFPDPGTKYEVPVKNASGCAWSADGRELIVTDPSGTPTAVEITVSNGLHVGGAHPLFALPPGTFVRDYAPSTDRFLTVRPSNFTGWSTLEMILGWPTLLEGK